MSEREQVLSAHDRRAELRLRLTTIKMRAAVIPEVEALYRGERPTRELVGRLIRKVRTL